MMWSLSIAIFLTLFVIGTFPFESYRNKSVELNGQTLFSAGFLYYWIVPLFFMIFVSNRDMGDLEGAKLMAMHVSSANLDVYAIVCLMVYFAFYAGYKLTGRKQPADLTKMYGKRLYLIFFVLVSIALAAIFGYLARDLMFKGYQASMYESYKGGLVSDFLTRGSFVASISYLFVVCFTVSACYCGKDIKTFLLSWPMVIYYGFSILALSMGGRLYFVSNVIALLLYINRFLDGKIRLKHLVGFFVAGAVLAGAWGVIRIGGQLGLGAIVINLFSEPILTSMSLFAFLADGKFPLVQFPVYFISDFANLLPSTLFPDKVSLFVNPADHGFIVYMPAGGMHVFVSSIVNFGVLGTPVVFFLLGTCIGFMEARVKSVLGGVSYCCIASWLVFSLHRDPFSVSMIKNILQTSIVIPLMIGVILRLLPDLVKPVNAK